jgi:hypothetical protein
MKRSNNSDHGDDSDSKRGNHKKQMKRSNNSDHGDDSDSKRGNHKKEMKRSNNSDHGDDSDDENQCKYRNEFEILRCIRKGVHMTRKEGVW